MIYYKARILWPTLIDFENWCARNCINCRWRYRPNFGQGQIATCNLLSQCLCAWLADRYIPNDIPDLMFGHCAIQNRTPESIAPHFCASRKDKRGRKKSPAF